LYNSIRRECYVKDSGSFYGRPTEAAIKYLRKGAGEAQQDAVREIMDKVDTSIERNTRRMVRSIAGGRVCVPDMLIGEPLHMRRKRHVFAENSPVRVVVEVIVSSGVDHNTLAVRGAATSALALALSEERPVELWAAWAMQPHGGPHGSVNVIGRVKLDTAPLSIANVTAVLTTAEFARAVTFANCYSEAQHKNSKSQHITWAWGAFPEDGKRTQMVRDALGLDANDIFIPGGHLSRADKMINDPVGWVEDNLKAQRGEQDEAA
jgi:hypothetical protein